MKKYKKEFIEFLVKHGALKFGTFTLKSGRISPYFLNTGALHSGEAVSSLGHFYAQAIRDRIDQPFTTVFGPAYKGIPLCVAVAVSLYRNFSLNINYAFNRKEIKDHGDKGVIVGKKPDQNDRLVLVDDVITAGTAIKESLEILKKTGNPRVVAVVLSVDRMEKGQGEESAIQELFRTTGIHFYPIVNIIEIIQYLKENQFEGQTILSEKMVERMQKYREKYGVDY